MKADWKTLHANGEETPKQIRKHIHSYLLKMGVPVTREDLDTVSTGALLYYESLIPNPPLRPFDNCIQFLSQMRNVDCEGLQPGRIKDVLRMELADHIRGKNPSHDRTRYREKPKQKPEPKRKKSPPTKTRKEIDIEERIQRTLKTAKKLGIDLSKVNAE